MKIQKIIVIALLVLPGVVGGDSGWPDIDWSKLTKDERNQVLSELTRDELESMLTARYYWLDRGTLTCPETVKGIKQASLRLFKTEGQENTIIGDLVKTSVDLRICLSIAEVLLLEALTVTKLGTSDPEWLKKESPRDDPAYQELYKALSTTYQAWAEKTKKEIKKEVPYLLRE